MFKSPLKICAGGVVLVLFCSAFVALFATVSNDEAAAYLRQNSAHQLAGVAPGQIYHFVDGEPTGVPICRLQDLSAILVRSPRGDMEFRNVLGESLPFIASLYSALTDDRADNPSGDGDDNLFTIRWSNVVEQYIPEEDMAAALMIEDSCLSAVQSRAAAGGEVCIVQGVLHNATVDGIAYAFVLRDPCIVHCPDYVCADRGNDTRHVTYRIGIQSKIKMRLGLITHEVFVANTGIGPTVALPN